MTFQNAAVRQPPISPATSAQAHLDRAGVTILLELSPSSLSRVFAIVCLLDLVPVAASCERLCDEQLSVDLYFESVMHRKFDLMVRKFNQLIEVLDVAVTRQAELYENKG